MLFDGICHLNLLITDGTVFQRMSTPNPYGGRVRPSNTLEAKALATLVPPCGSRLRGQTWFSGIASPCFPAEISSDQPNSDYFPSPLSNSCRSNFQDIIHCCFTRKRSSSITSKKFRNVTRAEFRRNSTRISGAWTSRAPYGISTSCPPGEFLEKARRTLCIAFSPLRTERS